MKQQRVQILDMQPEIGAALADELAAIVASLRNAMLEHTIARHFKVQ